MTYLAKPRVNFFSVDAMTNPSTANNENVIHLLDYNAVELVNPPQVTGAILPSMSDAAYREWMTSLIVYSDPASGLQHTSQPNWQPAMPGYWNYWGDHATTFGDATVSSVWTAQAPVRDPAVDSLCEARVVYNAKIVDLNPADTYTTQFVGAGLSVWGRDINGQPAELLSGVPSTAVTRWLNFYRIRGAGTFQAVLPNDSLRFIAPELAPKSQTLAALRAGAQAGGGLLVRWCFYGMAAAIDMMGMYNRMVLGERPANPKVGRVVGSIGIWNGRDPVSMPVGRILQQPGPPYFPTANGGAAHLAETPYVKTHEDVERIAEAGTKLHHIVASRPPSATMGPAAVVVEGDTAFVDLSTAFPEKAPPTGPADEWAKHDFGRVSLLLRYLSDPGRPDVTVGTISYDQQTYERLGGVWEIPLDSTAAKAIQDPRASLLIVDGEGATLVHEVEAPQVITDDQAVYLNLQDAGGAIRATGNVNIRIFHRGAPAADVTQLTVEHWTDVQTPGAVNSTNPLVVTATSISETLASRGQLQVPAGGESTVRIEANKPGCYKIRYLPPGMHPGGDDKAPQWAVEQFSCYRILPHDDYSAVPDEEITFDFVYHEVLHYYTVLYPVMSEIIPWGPANTPHDPVRVAQFAALMLQAIDARHAGTALEMPITRELSTGKRELLRRWCVRQLTLSSAEDQAR